MDGAVLGGNEVVVSCIINREIYGQTTRVDELHTTCLLLGDSASIYIFLGGVCLSLQLLKITILKTLLHRPLHNTSITRDRNEGFGFVLALDPLDFPDDVSVLVSYVLGRGKWEIVLCVTHIENRDVTMRIATGN